MNKNSQSNPEVNTVQEQWSGDGQLKYFRVFGFEKNSTSTCLHHYVKWRQYLWSSSLDKKMLIYIFCFIASFTPLKNTERGRSQDGGGLGRGDHFLPYKFIERTTEHWANFTKQLLIAGRGHQAPRKAAHRLWKEVGQNIKDEKRDKRARDGDPSREGSLNRGSFQSPWNPHTGGSGGSFWISEGNLTGRKN